MVTGILSIASLIGFAIFCRFLIMAVIVPVPVINQRDFSKTALRVEKGYKIICYATMSIVFLGAMATSFYQVFTQL